MHAVSDVLQDPALVVEPVRHEGASRLQRRRRIVVGGALMLTAMSVGGLVGSTWVKSPAQMAADTAPPAANLLTASVQSKILTSTVILRGVFSPGGTFQVTPTSVAQTQGNPGGGPMVVTAVPASQGAAISPGQVLVEYSGRPVYALPGTVPAYRDMLPGESGKDIAQLQTALASLGFGCGSDVHGTFGPGTESAVTRFYAHIGYPVPTTSSAATGTGTGTGKSSTANPPSSAAAMVPMSEVVFIPSFPASTQALPAVGQTVSSPLITLVDGGLSLTGQLDPSDAGLIKAGMQVQVYSETTGLQETGTVTGVGALANGSAGAGSQTTGNSAPAGQGQGASNANGSSGASYIPLQITPDSPWPAALNGQDVRITVTAATTGAPVIAVPEAAISASANAQTSVTVVDKNGTLHTVQVRAGVSADGLVQVSAIGTALTSGEQVVVGQ